MRRLAIVSFLLVASAAIASAEPRLRSGTDTSDDPTFVPPTTLPLASTNVIYLNRCASSCTIYQGSTSNSINNTWPTGAQRILSPFKFDDATWNKVVACVKDVFEPYNLVITETNPGTAPHFEIMIAGEPEDVGRESNVGGTAPGGCFNGYLNNALVFDFANVWSFGASTCDSRCVENICATAAQEIGHTWGNMDHVIESQDPMTYFNSTRRKYFQDATMQCGSDCVGGVAPGNVGCTGTDTQEHVCRCSSGQRQTQNSYTIIKDLFGLSPGSPPTVEITSPKAGGTVDKGFAISINATDNSNTIARLDVKLDGTVVDTSMIDTYNTLPPWKVYAPATLQNGTHRIEVTAYDPQQSRTTAMLDVQQNPPCSATVACPGATDACIGDRCVPGPGEPGGLGESCMYMTDCQSGQCALDDSEGHCVETCNAGECPDGFGCLESGGQGFCWPGYDESGGCGCQSGRSGGGAMTLGLLFAVGVFLCRRRRR